MPYSQAVIDHYNNPQNVGKFAPDEEYVGTGMVGAPACGDVMRLQIKINPKTTVIEDAKFQTFGCMAAIASSEYSTKEMIGLTVKAALKKITRKKISGGLFLPPAKGHCSVLAEEAIIKAIQDYIKKYGPLPEDEAIPHHNGAN